MHLGGGFNRLERNEEDLTRKAPTALGIPGLSVPVLDWGEFPEASQEWTDRILALTQSGAAPSRSLPSPCRTWSTIWALL